VESNCTTERLIQQIRQGDHGSVDTLYRRYALRVLFRVRVRMGPRLRLKEESGDLAQEAILRSLAALVDFEYRSEGAFFAFLANKVEQVIRDRLDYWDAEKRNPDREISAEKQRSSQRNNPLSIMGGRSEITPWDLLEEKEDFSRLAMAMDSLRQENEKHWELIVARDLDQQSFAEIARNWDRTTDAVKQQYYRARAALARLFRLLE
jgi:RNA polymerase sigma factor (sigma-70 family)